MERSVLSPNTLLAYSQTTNSLQNSMQHDDLIADLRTRYGKSFLPAEHNLVFYDRGNGILQTADGMTFSPENGICISLLSDATLNGTPVNKFKINTEAYSRLSIWKKMLIFLNNFFLVNDFKDFATDLAIVKPRYPSLE
jgi:hypothetical protein